MGARRKAVYRKNYALPVSLVERMKNLVETAERDKGDKSLKEVVESAIKKATGLPPDEKRALMESYKDRYPPVVNVSVDIGAGIGEALWAVIDDLTDEAKGWPGRCSITEVKVISLLLENYVPRE